MNFEKIPRQSMIESRLPIKTISSLALIEGNAKRPVYSIHKWWARRLSSVVRSLIIGACFPSNSTEDEFWAAYYQKCTLNGLTVLDPFMGGGTCLVEAKKLQAQIIGVDIDPLACFITKKEIEPLDDYKVKEAYQAVLSSVSSQVQKFYYTLNNGKEYEVINFFWTYKLRCPKCKTEYNAQPNYYLAKDKKNIFAFCKFCGEVHILPSKRKRFKCTACQRTTDIYKGNFTRGSGRCPTCNHNALLASNVNGISDLNLFAIEYVEDGKKSYKKADDKDQEMYANTQGLLNNIEKNYHYHSRIYRRVKAEMHAHKVTDTDCILICLTIGNVYH